MLRWLVVLVCLVWTSEAAADAFVRGQQHYRAGSYEQAREIWQPLAEGGHLMAQYSLGVMYERGQAVEKDVVEAARWFAIAAGAGYPPAVTALRSLAPALLAKLDAKREAEMTAGGKPPPQPGRKPEQPAMHGDGPLALQAADREAAD